MSFEAKIFIVSDGRGNTCTQVVNAALVQFQRHPSEFVCYANVRTPQEVYAIVEEAANDQSVIFYTLVSEKTRRAMKEASHHRLVPAVDVLGPAFSALHDVYRADPESKPGLLYESDRNRYDRIDAIDYTLKHDDGQRPHELYMADVVLVGVSRASKSTTCFYLAYEGIRAANLPLLPHVAPPPDLLRLDPAKVIGLKINPMRLRTIREARLFKMKMGWVDQYVDKREIAREVRVAHELMKSQGWRSIDVSYMAIEEIASEVMEMCGLKRRLPR